MSGEDRFVLFCNDGYGRPFETAFRAWCARRGIAGFAVVKSLKGAVPRGLPGTVLRARVAVANLLSCRAILAENVNGARFARAHLSGEGRLFGVVSGFNQIFRAATIRRFARLLNFHPSLLPYYRGPVPSYWCIRNGETATGITLHDVVPEIDGGPILWQASLPIATADPGALDSALAELGAAFLPDVLDALRETRPLPVRVLAADEIYRTPVDYASFPGRDGR